MTYPAVINYEPGARMWIVTDGRVLWLQVSGRFSTQNDAFFLVGRDVAGRVRNATRVDDRLRGHLFRELMSG